MKPMGRVDTYMSIVNSRACDKRFPTDGILDVEVKSVLEKDWSDVLRYMAMKSPERIVTGGTFRRALNKRAMNCCRLLATLGCTANEDDNVLTEQGRKTLFMIHAWQFVQ